MFMIAFMFSVFTVSTASTASDCKISLSKISESKNGYIGEITIKNTGNKEIDQWKLEFDWEKEISDVLNATLVSRQNNHYIITFNKSNRTIPAGKSLKIKIKGKKTIGSSQPSNYKLTDIYDELALKDKEWQYLKTRHDVDKKELGIYGASYGASKAIASAARYKDIKVLLSEAGMAYIGDVYGMPKDDVWLSFMKTYLNIPQDIDLTKAQYNAVDYSSAIKDVHVPVLILHGIKDSVIPLSSADLLMANANGPKEIYLMPESDHCNWFLTADKAEYENTVLNFLNKYLAR